MKKIILTFLILLNIFTNAQNYLVIYKHVEDNVVSNAKLLINSKNNTSLYTNIIKEIIPKTEYFDENNNLKGTYRDTEDYFYKDFTNSSMYSYAKIKYNMKSILKEPLIKDWVINKNKNNTKIIFGHKCFEAKTFYRGRYYTAYFTKFKNLKDGPRKFAGINGIILEIFEDTGKLKIIANSINETNIEIINPFSTLKSEDFETILSQSKNIFHKKKTELEEKYRGKVNVDFSNNLDLYNLN